MRRALGLLAVSALASLALVPSANAAAVGTAGPVDAANGYPAFYSDANGTRLAPCLQLTNCVLLADPGFDPTQAVSFPNNFPSEWFYFVSDSDKLTTDGCGGLAGRITLRNAIEGTFLNGDVVPGDQMTFTRLKIVASGLCPNTAYRFQEPYGTIDITTNASGAISANKAGGTFDQACGGAPCDYTIPLSGPAQGQATSGWLKSTSAPVGFLGDGATLATITGSPVGQNFFRVTRVDTGALVAQTTLFTVAGMLAPGSSMPDLAAADDTGASTTDNVTNVVLPHFSGLAGVGDAVTLYDGSTAIGSAAAGADGTWSITPSAPLSEGTHSITATSTPSGGTESLKSVALAVTVDTQAPLAPTGLATAPAGVGSTLAPRVSGATAEGGSTVSLFSDAFCATAAVASGSAADFMAAGIPVAVSANATTTVDATATDLAGNVSPCSTDTATYTSDTIAPADPVLDAASGPKGIVDTDAATFRFSDAEMGALQCSLDGAPFAPCSSGVLDYANLTQGAHTFQVRAVDLAGNASAVVSRAWTVDSLAPAVSAPVATLLGGKLGTTTLRVHVAWSATDATAPIVYELQQSTNGGAFRDVAFTERTSENVTVAPGKSYRFRVRGTDGLGTMSAWMAAPAAKLSLVQETGSSIAYAGAWGKRTALAGASGGFVRSASKVGARATYTFSGSGVAFVSTKGKNRGSIAVSIDGGAPKIVHLFARTTATRQVVFAANGLASGRHTLRITVATKDRAATGSRVDLDAIAVL